MRINARKTEIVDFNSDVTGDGADTHPTVDLVGGSVKDSDEFKYLGAIQCATQGSAKEIDMRNARVLGAMESLSAIWLAKKMRLPTKMRVYHTMVLPHSLYGCEAWTATQGQVKKLAITHNHCLRRIMGIELEDRRPLSDIYERCGSEPLDLTIAKRVTRWAGHVMRMDGSRYPRLALECSVHNEHGDSIGAAWTTGMRHYYKGLWESTGFVVPQQYMANNNIWTFDSWRKMWDEFFVRAQDRLAWRNAVHNLSILSEAAPDPTPLRRNPVRAVRSLQTTAAGAAPTTY